MNEDAPIGAALTAPNQSQLERFSMELGKQADLLNMLQSRLDVVSERSPQKEDGEAPSERVHLASLINQLARNNRRLNRIIEEITL